MDATEGVELFVMEVSTEQRPESRVSIITLSLVLEDSQLTESPDIPTLLDSILSPGSAVTVSRPTPKSLLKPAVVAGEAPAPCIPAGDAAGTW